MTITKKMSFNKKNNKFKGNYKQNKSEVICHNCGKK